MFIVGCGPFVVQAFGLDAFPGGTFVVVCGPFVVQAFGLECFPSGTFVVFLWLQWLVVLVCIVGFLWADGDCNGVGSRRLGHVHFT